MQARLAEPSPNNLSRKRRSYPQSQEFLHRAGRDYMGTLGQLLRLARQSTVKICDKAVYFGVYSVR
jgi:hypothetical protein